MHELALAQQVARIVSRKALELPDSTRVAAVHVEIGRLRQVVPESLARAWDMVIKDTSLAGCTLAVDSLPARVLCSECAGETEMGEVLDFVCGACGSTKTTVRTGEEFRLTGLDIERRGD